MIKKKQMHQKERKERKLLMNMVQTKSSKFFVLLLSALMIIQSFGIMPGTSYAEESSQSSITCDVGISGLPIELSFEGHTDKGKTNSDGKFASDSLYSYLDSLGWNAETEAEDPSGEEEESKDPDAEPEPEPDPQEPTVTEVKVNYEINYPNESTPEARESSGGRIDYKGIKGTFTIKYDKDGDWKKAVKLDAPDKEKKLEGVLSLIPFGKGVSSAKPLEGVDVILTDGSTTKTYTTNKDGEFYFYGYESGDKDVTLKVSATNQYPALKESVEEFKGKLYLKERPSVSDSDYTIVGAYNGYVARPDADKEYTIKAEGSNKLSLSRDGEATDKVTVTLTPEGKTTPFYVEKSGVCSNAVENAIKIDETAPELTDIDTKAVNEVKIKKHGIYSKQRADLLITVTVTEKESGLEQIKLVGKNSDGLTYYDTSSIKTQGGKTEATFIIESQEELLTQTLYLTGEDRVGNKSKDVLLRGSEDPSKITMEIIPPSVEDIKVKKGKINSNGWYKEPLSFSVDTTDTESGLSDVDVTTNNSVSLYSKTYEDKVTTKETASFALSEKTIREDKNGKGEYKILAKVVDNSGNITAKSISVKIDLDAPVLSLTGVEKGAYLQKAPTLKIVEDEEYYTAKGNHFTVSVTRDKRQCYQKTFNQVNKATIPASVFAIDGDYKVTVTCEDAAGNKAKSIGTYFVKDKTAPVVSIIGPSGGKFYNKAQTNTIQVKERYYESNDVHINVTRTLGGKTVKVAFPWKNKDIISKSTKTFSETGEYRISVYAIDKAGNRSATKTLKYSVDTVPPKLSINGISEGKTYNYNAVVAPAVVFSDDYLAGRTIKVTRAGNDWYGKLSKSEGKGSIKFSNFQKIKNNDGLYSISVSVSDKAGNTTKKTVSFTVNRFGSAFKYNEAINQLNNRSVQNVTDELAISELNVSKLTKTKNELKLDGNALDTSSKTEENGTQNGYRVYRHVYSADLFESEGVYELNVISADAAGNTMESKKENGQVKFTVDRTKPTLKVTGFEKYNKAETLLLNVSTTDNLSSPEVTATVDGQSVPITNDGGTYIVKLDKGANQNVRIAVTDSAGNTEVFEETVSVIPNGILFFLMKYKLPLGCALLVIAAIASIVVLKKKRGRKSDN